MEAHERASEVHGIDNVELAFLHNRAALSHAKAIGESISKHTDADLRMGLEGKEAMTPKTREAIKEGKAEEIEEMPRHGSTKHRKKYRGG